MGKYDQGGKVVVYVGKGGRGIWRSVEESGDMERGVGERGEGEEDERSDGGRGDEKKDGDGADEEDEEDEDGGDGEDDVVRNEICVSTKWKLSSIGQPKTYATVISFSK